MEKTQQPPQHFSPEEAAKIMREATKLSLERDADAALSTRDLEAMAKELGIDPVILAQVLERRAADAELQEQQRVAAAELKRRRTTALRAAGASLATYLVVIAGLTGLDIAGGPGWWVQWPAMGWGIGVALQLVHALSGKDRSARHDEKLERRGSKHERRGARRNGR